MNKLIWLIIILSMIVFVLVGILIFVPTTPGKNRPIPPVGDGGIFITNLKEGQEVSSPLKILGFVDGNGWGGFEGQVGTVKLLDFKGNELASGILGATTDWMTFPVQFESTVNFVLNNDGPGTLVFHNENPSDMRDKDKTFSLPVKIKSGETTTVKAFFGKNEVTGTTCSIVFPVERTVAKTQSVARVALEELIKGPSESEKAQGFFSNINHNAKIQSLVIDEKGTAKVDFSSEMETTGGSCRVTEIRSEINFTLKQFPTIKDVIISINGRTEDILQP